MTAGLSSANFRRIASASSHSVSASAVPPVVNSSQPRLLWLSARSSRNWADGGVGVGQPPQDRQRLAYSARAPAPSAPSGDVSQRDIVVGHRQSELEPVTSGLSSASFCRIASASRRSASASDGRLALLETDAEVDPV